MSASVPRSTTLPARWKADMTYPGMLLATAAPRSLPLQLKLELYRLIYLREQFRGIRAYPEDFLLSVLVA
jgi:hypothetical protein